MASGGAASATVVASKKMLIGDFIFEVADSGGKTTVGSHVGVAEQAETQLEVERLGEHLFLEDPGADNLTRNGNKHFVFARGEDVNLSNFRFLVKLLGAEFNRLARAMLLGLLLATVALVVPSYGLLATATVGVTVTAVIDAVVVAVGEPSA